MPLDPDRLTPAASLNRTRIVGLPGVALDASIRDRAASDVLSAGALAEQVRWNARALGLDALRDASATDLLPAFAARFALQTPAVRVAADAVARRFGRALGALILMLRRGDHISREARPEWDASYWDQWAALRTVWLGGGLMAGAFGERVRVHAAGILAEDRAHSCDLRLAAYPALLPLIGAACSLPSPGGAALVLDCGHSAIKRGIAMYDGGELTELRLLSPVPVAGILLPTEDAPRSDGARDLAERIAGVLAAAWLEAIGDPATGPPLAPLLAISMASYMCDGHPMPRQGGLYAGLHALPENAQGWLSRRLSERVGRPLAVSLLHDGTAAARVYAGTERAAVITLGTALGAGFVPREPAATPVAPGFALS